MLGSVFQYFAEITGEKVTAAQARAVARGVYPHPKIPVGYVRGENGVLVDPDDVAGLSDALVRLLGDRPAAERLGAGARRTGEEWVVTPQEYAARVEELIRLVLR